MAQPINQPDLREKPRRLLNLNFHSKVPTSRGTQLNHLSDSSNTLVLSYLGLRKAIGIIGTSLPFVLAFGKMLLESPGIQSSISAYYYTDMRDVFVGSLCAIAVFLMSYRGYDRRDHLAGDLACAFAIGVALFPTTPEGNATSQTAVIGAIHIICAFSFFLTLAYFSLVLFRKTDPNKSPSRRKLQRNMIYTVCGYTILVSIAMIAILALFPHNAPVKKLDPFFWLESLAVVAFGISWLTKGETILKDET
jgi:hypothetical protein